MGGALVGPFRGPVFKLRPETAAGAVSKPVVWVFLAHPGGFSLVFSSPPKNENANNLKKQLLGTIILENAGPRKPISGGTFVFLAHPGGFSSSVF